ncbi:MAG TPA: hypothetical protein VGE97_02275 [Nitrososphaera sp.]
MSAVRGRSGVGVRSGNAGMGICARGFLRQAHGWISWGIQIAQAGEYLGVSTLCVFLHCSRYVPLSVRCLSGQSSSTLARKDFSYNPVSRCVFITDYPTSPSPEMKSYADQAT